VKFNADESTEGVPVLLHQISPYGCTGGAWDQQKPENFTQFWNTKDPQCRTYIHYAGFITVCDKNYHGRPTICVGSPWLHGRHHPNSKDSFTSDEMRCRRVPRAVPYVWCMQGRTAPYTAKAVKPF